MVSDRHRVSSNWADPHHSPLAEVHTSRNTHDDNRDRKRCILISTYKDSTYVCTLTILLRTAPLLLAAEINTYHLNNIT